MPPPPPRKPAPPARPKASESFIGNDSTTMMTEETFEEFEARMKSEEGASGATNTNPAIEERDDDDEGR